MDYIGRTIELALENVKKGGRPFACIVVKNGKILAEETNLVVQTKDPTAHAEMIAIRKVSQLLNSESFAGCEFYILAHPCPMCLAAIYYCSPDKVTFIMHRDEYAEYYADSRKYFTLREFYEEIHRSWNQRKLPMVHAPDPRGIEVYKLWRELNQTTIGI